jgi:uridine phosphorylase
LELGELVVADLALCHDGTSRALGAGASATPDRELTAALACNIREARVGPVVSVDLFYEPEPPFHPAEALAVEMEAAALFSVGARAGVAAACILTVSDTFDGAGGRRRIGDADLLESAETMGQAALSALTPP